MTAIWLVPLIVLQHVITATETPKFGCKNPMITDEWRQRLVLLHNKHRKTLAKGEQVGANGTLPVAIEMIYLTRIAFLNVGTLTGRSRELAAALEDRRIDLRAVQETRWSGNKSKDIGHDFKVVYNGSTKTRNGVGIVVSQRCRDSIAEVQRFDDRLMKVVVTTAEQRLHFFSAYAPQTGCCEQVKDDFWMLLDEKTAEELMEDTIVVAGDLNGHVGAAKDGYTCHGGFGYGIRNDDGERILEYADSHDLVIMNTKFRKRPSHLVSFYSGNVPTQIDFVLVRHRDQKLVTDAKVVPYKAVATQHRPLICTMKIMPPKRMHDERCGPARIKW
ncbi:hypothetical protein Y032_0133g1803 [Ancylostoma ceylanicum]|uniref:Endonuclease/exonuclease/phosphatase domain-containing protein n=1 Tax=Ancylostoma ceylanicum TaxID=53326 RepID=A0A016T6A0_9BILA|nr:hypothetical protein Y032_0133g1803 [Ancylostoma ceylanicum]